MKARVITQWIVYYVVAAAWLGGMIVLMVGRAQSSPHGPWNELLTGALVVGGGLLASSIFMALIVIPCARTRAELRRQFPGAIVENVGRKEIRRFLDDVRDGASASNLPWWVTVVATRAGISFWQGGDQILSPKEQIRELVTVPWADVTALEIGTTGERRPQWTVEVTVGKTDGDLIAQLALASEISGGAFFASLSRCSLLLADLERMREEAHSGPSSLPVSDK